MTQLIYKERELRVMQAYEIFQNDNYNNIRKCVKNFACNRRNLQNQLNKILFKSNRFSIYRRYTKTQEQVIVDYIIRLNDINMLLTIELVVDIVNCLLLFNIFINDYWFKCFYKKHLKLKTCCQTSIAIARKNVFSNIATLELYFKKLKIVINEKDIQSINYWNIDKTNFCINCKRVYTIVIKTIRDVL